MEFTYTEKNGSKPIDEWLIKSLKSYAEKEHGMKLNVRIKDCNSSPPMKASGK